MGSGSSKLPAKSAPSSKSKSDAATRAQKLKAWEASLQSESADTAESDVRKKSFSRPKPLVGPSLLVAGVTHIGPGDPPIKDENQDTFLLRESLGGVAGVFLGAVFDGHGNYGSVLSEFCRDWVAERLPKMLAEPGARRDPSTVLGRCFAACEDSVHNDADIGFRSKMSGTTATAVLLDGDQLFVACVGDSRAVLCSDGADGKLDCRRLTRDHRPELQDESERINRSGGETRPSNASAKGPMRVYLAGETYRDHGLDVPGPGLMLTRSLGDRIAKAAGCTAEPEVERVLITARDRFLVIGSDGVWDVLSDESVAEIVRQSMQDPATAADRILAESLGVWSARGGADNITVVVVVFQVAPD